jgi:hypothetical protein
MSSAEQRMRATAAGLTAAGLNTRVCETNGVLDITATVSHDGSKDTQVIVDEDDYVQVSYWNPAAATPAEIVATIVRVLATIITARPAAPPP